MAAAYTVIKMQFGLRKQQFQFQFQFLYAKFSGTKIAKIPHHDVEVHDTPHIRIVQLTLLSVRQYRP